MLANMLMGIANRCNMQNQPTMLANIYKKINKCWPTFLANFFLCQHVHSYSKSRQHVGQQMLASNVGRNVAPICGRLKAYYGNSGNFRCLFKTPCNTSKHESSQKYFRKIQIFIYSDSQIKITTPWMHRIQHVL